MSDVRFAANGGEATGYLAQPARAGAPGVIVLQEWWGLDDHIRSVCDRLAAEGFYALAPDLYRQPPTAQPSEAQQRMMALSMDQAVMDMRGAAQYLLALDGVRGPRVGAIGFCLGGGLAVWAAATIPLVGPTVTYYYVMPHGKPNFGAIAGPVLGHFGTADDFIPVVAARELEDELRAAGVETTFEFHDGAGHAFFNDTNRLGTYNPDNAERSWQRTIGFLHEHLRQA